jgi:hypothetical protein
MRRSLMQGMMPSLSAMRMQASSAGIGAVTYKGGYEFVLYLIRREIL